MALWQVPVKYDFAMERALPSLEAGAAGFLFEPSRMTPRIMVLEGNTIIVSCQRDAIHHFLWSARQGDLLLSFVKIAIVD